MSKNKPDNEELHIMTVQGGSGDMTGAVLHVTCPARGRVIDFTVVEKTSDDGEIATYSMIPHNH